MSLHALWGILIVLLSLLVVTVALPSSSSPPRRIGNAAVGGMRRRKSTMKAAFVLPVINTGALPHSSCLRKTHVVCAAKGKKQKTSRRGRKESSRDEDDGEGGNSMDGDDDVAPRVSSQINIPVRRQIAFVKQMKKLMKEEERPNVVTGKSKARKKKALTQREAIAADYPSFNPALCTTYLLVDGYNVIKYVYSIKGGGGNSTHRIFLTLPHPYSFHSKHTFSNPILIAPGPR